MSPAGAGARTSPRGVRSNRATGVPRSTGTSPPTTAGTRRATRPPCARSGSDGTAVVETRRAHPRGRCGAPGVLRGRPRRPHRGGGGERVVAADRRGVHPRRSAHRAAAHGADRGHRPAGGQHCRARRAQGHGDGRAAPRRPRCGHPAGRVALDATGVVRGWTATTERASRLLLPDAPVGPSVVAVRCELLLCGPAHPDDDPIAFLLGVGDLVRMGDAAEPWLPDVAHALEMAAKGTERGWALGAAIDAAAIVLPPRRRPGAARSRGDAPPRWCRPRRYPTTNPPRWRVRWRGSSGGWRRRVQVPAT